MSLDQILEINFFSHRELSFIASIRVCNLSVQKFDNKIATDDSYLDILLDMNAYFR